MEVICTAELVVVYLQPAARRQGRPFLRLQFLVTIHRQVNRNSTLLTSVVLIF